MTLGQILFNCFESGLLFSSTRCRATGKIQVCSPTPRKSSFDQRKTQEASRLGERTTDPDGDLITSPDCALWCNDDLSATIMGYRCFTCLEFSRSMLPDRKSRSAEGLNLATTMIVETFYRVRSISDQPLGNAHCLNTHMLYQYLREQKYIPSLGDSCRYSALNPDVEEHQVLFFVAVTCVRPD